MPAINIGTGLTVAPTVRWSLSDTPHAGTAVTVAPNLMWSLRRAAGLHGESVSVVDGNTRVSYPELLSWCDRLASGLARRGAARGDRIAILGANSAEYLAAYFGVPAAGYVLVPLNARLADAELLQLVQDCEPAILVADEVQQQRAEALTRSVGTGVVTFGQLLAEPAEATVAGRDAEVSSTDLAAIFYTGGTTGRAKGAMLTHGNLAANALHMIAGLGYAADDVYLHCSPMFHLGDGMSTYPITWAGGRHVVIPRFDPKSVVDAIETERVTCTFLVPTMLTLLLEYLDQMDIEPDLSALRLVVHGGAPISPTLLDRAIARLGCSFTQSYGMTEAGPILSFLPNEDRLLGSEVLRSAGRPVIGVEVRVVRPDGTDCEIGEIGEIVGRGPNFAVGYWRQPEVTRQRFRDGWYWSGDLAYRDESFYLYIVGRAGEAIISGGENVYAAEVEAALTKHLDVVEASVFAVPSAHWGEQVHAAVVLRGEADMTEADLDRHCRDLIAGYKTPRSYEFHAQLPRTGPGKIDKLALRRPHWAAHERDVS
ncbi:class I adenylate-forming enzyme family protein [Rhodococcus sp. OK302]|uniref:class I adenylate-forming enzyme family protein n=1 Tax=Rhodococcus sp. OK302 TaxID=1882769 RepID=UPI000B9F9182|nr:AMP-binding protein [Rhodococcus sp. OK302]OYD61427.1 acyl-CoA synthetase (AMP-forming)/AMP-acid ligase II [Rhodococcus sp. OK302]